MSSSTVADLEVVASTPSIGDAVGSFIPSGISFDPSGLSNACYVPHQYPSENPFERRGTYHINPHRDTQNIQHPFILQHAREIHLPPSTGERLDLPEERGIAHVCCGFRVGSEFAEKGGVFEELGHAAVPSAWGAAGVEGALDVVEAFLQRSVVAVEFKPFLATRPSAPHPFM